MDPIANEIFSLAMLFYWSESDTPFPSGKFLGEKSRQDDTSTCIPSHEIQVGREQDFHKGRFQNFKQMEDSTASITLQPKDQITSNNQDCLSHQITFTWF